MPRKRRKVNKQPMPQPIKNAASYNASRLLNDVMPNYSALFDSETLSPAIIKSAVSDYRIFGHLQELSNIFDLFMDMDDNLQGKVDVRKEALKQATWSFGDIPQEKHDFFDKVLSAYLPSWVDMFIPGKLYGFHFLQLVYSMVDGYYVPSQLLDYKNLDLRIENRELICYDRGKPMDYPPYKFLRKLYTRPKLHSIVKYYVFYAFALNNWGQFTETYGKPMRVGKYEPNVTAPELEVLRQAVKALGTDQAAVISKNTEIDFRDFAAKSESQNLFHTLCEYVSTKVTIAILGQTLTTQEGATGSYAQAKVHEMVREDLKQADITDLRWFVGTILNNLDAINFGGKGIDLWLELPKRVELEKRIGVDQSLVIMGLPIAQDYFYDTYGVDRPKDGQELIAAPRPAAEQRAEQVKEENSYTPQRYVNSAKPMPKSLDVHLQKLQDEIRSIKTIEELKEYNPQWFIAEFGSRLAVQAVSSYVSGRKSRRRRNASLPKIIFEWDNESIADANIIRNQAVIIGGVRTKAALAELVRSAVDAVDVGSGFTEYMSNAVLSGFAPENPYHLKTEFETAQVSAAASGKWKELQADADLFPYLKYVTMQDDLVRDDHIILDGVVARVDDPFWAQNYPPNGWNCRCDVEQLTEEEAKESPLFDVEPPFTSWDPEFNGNVGMETRLPGGADKLYGEYAEGNNMAEPNSAMPFVNATKPVFDALQYPVIMADMDVSKVLKRPTEIWQNREGGVYLQVTDKDEIEIVRTSRGVVIDYETIPIANYAGEGKEGFREYVKIS